MNKLLLYTIYFLASNAIYGQLTIARPTYKSNIEPTNYIKVGKHTITGTDNFRVGGTKNSKYIEINNKFYYLVLDDSLMVIEKTKIIPIIFCSTSRFYEDSIIYSSINDIYLNKDSILPKKAELYTFGFYRSGKHIEYYSNGKLKVTRKYQENAKIGVWKYYSEDGKVMERKKFIKGREKGVEPPIEQEE